MPDDKKPGTIYVSREEFERRYLSADGAPVDPDAFAAVQLWRINPETGKRERAERIKVKD